MAALFTALTALFVKPGVSTIDADLAVFIKSIIVDAILAVIVLRQTVRRDR